MNIQKTAIIVGASRGLGAATARIASESGTNLLISARPKTS